MVQEYDIGTAPWKMLKSLLNTGLCLHCVYLDYELFLSSGIERKETINY